MAVYQGARLRTAALPAAAPVARPRSSATASGRATPRVRPMGLLLAGILAGTMLGLVYLTQTLGSNATTSEIRGLEATRAALTRELRQQATRVWFLIDSEEIAGKARKLGLQQRGDSVVLKAP